jgi:hypothetical protein
MPASDAAPSAVAALIKLILNDVPASVHANATVH